MLDENTTLVTVAHAQIQFANWWLPKVEALIEYFEERGDDAADIRDDVFEILGLVGEEEGLANG